MPRGKKNHGLAGKKKYTRGWYGSLLLNLIHIETIFLIAVTIFLIWYVIKRRRGEIVQDFHDYDASKMERKKVVVVPKGKKNEYRIKAIVERIFGCEFKTIRPNWLKNPVTGSNLEIDLWNSDIETPLGHGLGVEVDGIQHAQHSPYFHRTPGSFEYQVKKDRWKDKKCLESGVLLIRVPHFVVPNDQERYIREKLRAAGVRV